MGNLCWHMNWWYSPFDKQWEEWCGKTAQLILFCRRSSH
jgi:hypothetical protein